MYMNHAILFVAVSFLREGRCTFLKQDLFWPDSWESRLFLFSSVELSDIFLFCFWFRPRISCSSVPSAKFRSFSYRTSMGESPIEIVRQHR